MLGRLQGLLFVIFLFLLFDFSFFRSSNATLVENWIRVYGFASLMNVDRPFAVRKLKTIVTNILRFSVFLSFKKIYLAFGCRKTYFDAYGSIAS